MFPQIIIFIIKYTAIVSIDHMSLIILIVAFLIPSVRHMYMPVDKNLGWYLSIRVLKT